MGRTDFTFSSRHLVHGSRRKSGVWRDNQKYFAHKAALGTVVQKVENGLIRFGKRSFNAVNFQRPDWICGSFYTAFKLAELVEITNLDKGGEHFFAFPNRP